MKVSSLSAFCSSDDMLICIFFFSFVECGMFKFLECDGSGHAGVCAREIDEQVDCKLPHHLILRPDKFIDFIYCFILYHKKTVRIMHI